ncbi:phosphoribosyltransferase [uncultured Lutibacter sp.]|uniref:phosphoribosyltransferase n=1 Tax=uncultured Lutibacter sp. TaxID=437739 RepID=UPI0026197D8A|nr:phosphoribosyltransferase family protein [uncultured Lutibacter sp.]
MFVNREEAGNLLADKLMNYCNNSDAVIVAIPRGGVPVGSAMSKKLNLPLEIVLSKKIGHPFNKEYAIGAVTLKNRILGDSVLGISKLYIEEETERVRTILKKRYQLYYSTKKPIELKGKTVILVDDGVATGNTLISSIKLIQLQKPSSMIVALPVSSPSALKNIKKLPNILSIICLFAPRDFRAVGQFYDEFNQVNDTEVIKLLKEANDNFQLNYSNS